MNFRTSTSTLAKLQARLADLDLALTVSDIDVWGRRPPAAQVDEIALIRAAWAMKAAVKEERDALARVISLTEAQS